MAGTDRTRDEPGRADAARRLLRALATPREVDFLVARVFGDVPCGPASRQGLAFLAGVASRSRRRGLPFAAAWSLVARAKRLDELADPDARAFWARVRSGMRALASPDWPSEGPEYADQEGTKEFIE